MNPQPPGTGTLADQLRALARRVDELARAKPAAPACVVKLTGDTGLPAGQDVFAQLGWTATYDPLSQYVPGAAGTPACIQIARSGYHRVHFHSSIAGPAATAGAKVSLAPNSVANSIATDAGPVTQQGADGAVLDALRSRIYLNSGDRLCWSNWCSTAATLKGSVLGVPTEITVQYVNGQ